MSEFLYANVRTGKQCWNLCILTVLIFGLTAGCSGTLMADVAPPPDFQPTHQVSLANSAAPEISPLLPPDPEAGKIVYTEKCAPCHGPNGRGDGENVGSLPSLPPSLVSLDYSRSISPTVWFQTITQGRIDRLMPGFGSSLSDRQRWDVVAYLISMGTNSDQLDEGKQIYTDYCQSCHGTNAAGGVGAAPALTASDQQLKSLDDLVQVISAGKGSMPAFENKLPDDQKLAAAVYLRSLIFAPPSEKVDAETIQKTMVPTPISMETGTNQADQVLSGRVINGSGGAIPTDLEVELTGYDAMQSVYTQKQTVGKDGGFKFQQVPEETGRIYLLKAAYRGIVFYSAAIHSGQPEEMTNQQITIYESNTDTSQIKAERMHIFFDFPRTDVIRVSQLYVLANHTNTLITASMAGTPVVNYPLPTGATNLQFEGGSLGERFVLTTDGFGDTQGVPPGSGTQVLYSYELPYKNDLHILIKIPLPVDTTNIMLPSRGVSVKSSQLQDLGEKTIQDAVWHTYISGNLAAGSWLDLLITGRPKVTNPQEEELNTNLAVGVIFLATVLLIVFGSVMQKINSRKLINQPVVTPVIDQSTQDAVLDAIIALDDQYRAGQIPQAAYHERRRELKNRLRGVQHR